MLLSTAELMRTGSFDGEPLPLGAERKYLATFKLLNHALDAPILKFPTKLQMFHNDMHIVKSIEF